MLLEKARTPADLDFFSEGSMDLKVLRHRMLTKIFIAPAA